MAAAAGRWWQTFPGSEHEHLQALLSFLPWACGQEQDFAQYKSLALNLQFLCIRAAEFGVCAKLAVSS